MRLKKLEIYGFKSFAERTEMTFENGVTGIVGPNGCGKSNISDAVRWVLGEQSAKTLRGAKMEDVIFNGTEKRRRLSYCEVILTFDNEDRALSLDYAEVAVARRVYRSGESEYMINGAPCRLRDISELFRDTGIGKEGYSLIGQGRIDEILSVRSEDRRQIFEEAAGIVKYKTRKIEAERRMENTRANLSRVEDIIAELESRVEPLRQQSEDAREYLQLQGELKGLELNAFLLRSKRYTQRIDELRATIGALAEAIEEATARGARLGETREREQALLSELEQRAAEGRERVQEMIRKVESDEGALGVIRERAAAAQRERERLLGETQAANEGQEGVSRQLDYLTGRIQAEQAQAAERKAALEKDEAELAERERALSQAEEEVERLKAELIETMNRISDVRSEQARLTAMREQLARRIQTMRQEAETGEGDAGQLSEREQAAAERLQHERAALEELNARSREADEAVRDSNARAEELDKDMRDLSARRQDVFSRLRVLEEMQRDYEGYQHSVKNVLMEARRRGGGGVRGVVANLIRVPRELEKAMDMVLGGALQNIVVEREEDAKRLIEFLRAGRLGRATFLPLSAVRGRTLDAAERRVLSMPGCMGVASELIEYEAEYRGVVESLLGRTVVSRDLESGIAIMRAARYAFRLVTLEGDVMNPGGSMTGGSATSRMTSLLSREREVNEHRAALKEMDGRLAQVKQSLDELAGRRAALKRERAALFDQLHQQEIACAREEAHLKAARGELDAHLQRARRMDEERERLCAQLSDVENALSQLSGRQSGEEEQNAGRQTRIAQLGRDIVQQRRETVDLRERTNAARVTLAAQERGIAAMTGDRDRLTAQRGDLDRLRRDNAQKLENCNAQIAQDEAELKRTQALLEEDRAALESARAQFRASDEARTAAQGRLREAADALDALRAELDDFTDRHHRGEIQLSRVEGEFKQLTDRIWEDYELSYEGALAFQDESFRLNDSEKRIAQIRARIRQMGSVNVGAVDEYRQTMERFNQLTAQRDDLIKAQLDLSSIIDELVRKMETQFRAQFELLNINFQQTFVKLFGGGRAELRLSDPRDALGCGIEIVAQPPGKKLQLLSLLSGGERALTAIAILFAMLKLKPTPFCFLDEIEAALDDANIDNYADYLKDFSRDTQFVVVTHRKGTMERCDALYGVAMEEKGVSRMVSVRLSEAQAM